MVLILFAMTALLALGFAFFARRERARIHETVNDDHDRQGGEVDLRVAKIMATILAEQQKVITKDIQRRDLQINRGNQPPTATAPGRISQSEGIDLSGTTLEYNKYVGSLDVIDLQERRKAISGGQ